MLCHQCIYESPHPIHGLSALTHNPPKAQHQSIYTVVSPSAACWMMQISCLYLPRVLLSFASCCLTHTPHPPDPLACQLLPWEQINSGDVLKRIERRVTVCGDAHTALCCAFLCSAALCLRICCESINAFYSITCINAVKSSCPSAFSSGPLPQLLRMYFVALSSAAPHEVDMSAVFSFDCYDRVMTRHEVIQLGYQHVDPVLRIRCYNKHHMVAMWPSTCLSALFLSTLSPPQLPCL